MRHVRHIKEMVLDRNLKQLLANLLLLAHLFGAVFSNKDMVLQQNRKEPDSTFLLVVMFGRRVN